MKTSMLISLPDFAKRFCKNVDKLRSHVKNGRFETAQKVGRCWFIDDAEPYPDVTEYKHFSVTDRIRLEQMTRDRKSPKEIAKQLQFSVRAVYYEMKRGQCEQLTSDLVLKTRYVSDFAEKKYRDNLAAKGAMLKIGNDHALAKFIERKILKDKLSPDLVVGMLKRNDWQVMHKDGTLQKFQAEFCTTTLYSYIDKGIFDKLTNKDLPIKSRRKRKYNRVRPKRPPRGESIEKRPNVINLRQTFGHWELDTVDGKPETKEAILVFTERVSRKEITVKLHDKTAATVVAALDELERRYGKLFPRVFQTITVDNGGEFSDCAGLERSVYGGQRTKFYYCHPRCPHERGSNENANKIIRIWVPKGTPIENYSSKFIAELGTKLNERPRKIFSYATSAEVFNAHLVALGIPDIDLLKVTTSDISAVKVGVFNIAAVNLE
jgi:IS30 family transposase